MTRVICLLLVLGAPLPAAELVFPGLRAVLSESEWKRAGLDRLDADQIAVIDSALSRYQSTPANAVAAPSPGTLYRQAVPETITRMDRFGFPSFNPDQASATSISAKVVKWRGGHRFVLDNGQVWEGIQPVPRELVGLDVQIRASGRGIYDLTYPGQETAARVLRVE